MPFLPNDKFAKLFNNMDTDNSRFIVQVFVGALSQHYEALSVEASKLTTSEEIVSCITERLSLGESSSGFELAEVVGDTMGRECKERRLGATECPVACMLLWPKSNTHQQYYRFYLREKVCESLWSEGFTMDPQLIKDYFYRFLYQPADREYPDLCQLPDLNEQTLLDNLKARFNAGHIYTYVGSILIAVNPFKFHPIYNPKYVKLYQKRRLGPELPPHIFAVADAAYHSMLKAKKNQCIVISGESGSGKTESTNFLLHHLTALSQKGSHGSGVEQTILSAGPVLEAFGNAKTAHNNNSSRFGKFIQVNYKENGMVHGAVVQKYLLEKSRICSQGRSERNYHVFYYLLAGASETDRQVLHLLQANQYNYLNRTVGGLENVDEKYEFSRLKQSMEMVGFTPEKQRRLFGVLSAVLLLGNVEFEVRKFGYHHCDEAVSVRNPDTVKLISDLLRVKEETLLAALTAKRARASGETLVINYRPHEAIAARDAMAKCLYGALFDWIVLQVNHALLSKKDTLREHQGNSIGVLDIFGFEDFGLFNSFEQFCINYANEHLQHYFNQHVFKYEQEEYRKEGIRWRDIDFLDNSPCLALIEGKPNGLLCLLDDQCNFPGASNETLLQKFNSVHKDNSFYEMPQKRENAFIVRHYAGKVKYQVVDMREKNVDLMRQDIVGVLKNSSLAFVRELVGADPVAVFRWAIVRAFFRGYFAFHDAGRKHRLTRDGSKPSSIHHRYRNHTPNENLIRMNRRNGDNCSSSVSPSTSASSFPSLKKGNNYNNLSKESAATSNAKNNVLRRISQLNPDEAKVFEKATQIVAKNKSFRPRERGKKGLKNLQSVKTLAGRAQSLGQLTKARKHPLTVTAQFQQSLNSLMITLNQANPFFIRCIKSNSDKVANLFDEEVVQRQLRYTGMLETVRIRQAGYNVRLTYDEFIHLYRILLPKGLCSSWSDVGDFLLTLNLNRDNYQVGSSKIFMRESEKVKLDYRLHQQIMASIVTIQRWYRACLDHQRFMRMKQAAITIQSYWKMYRVSEERKGWHIAAAQIQAAWRAYKLCRWYSMLKQSTVSFQAFARGYLIRVYTRQQLSLRRCYMEERHKLSVSKESSQEEPESESSGGGGGTHDSESEHGSDSKQSCNSKATENHLSRSANETVKKRSPPKRYWQHHDWRTQSQDSVSSANDVVSKLSGGAHSDGETEAQSNVWEVRMALPPRRNRPAGLGAAAGAGGSSVPSPVVPSASRSVDHATDLPNHRSSNLNRPSNILIKAGRRASDPISGDPSDQINQYSPSADLLEWKGTTMFSIAGHKFRKVSRFSKEDRCAFCINPMDAFFTQGHKCSDCKLLFHTKCIQNGGVVQLPCSGGSRRGKQSRKRPMSSTQRSTDSTPSLQHHNHRAKFNLTGTFEFTDSTDRIISDIKELQSMQEFISNKICKIEADEGEKASLVDRVFKQALKEFKDNLVATYSIANKHSHDTLNIKYKDLISNFLHVMEKVCHFENTKEDFPVTMCVNGFRGFMNEWMALNRVEADKPKKTKRKKEKKRKTEDPTIYFGHSFLLTIINIPTACEVCSSFFMWPIERGLVCQNCKLTCHKKCYTKVIGLCNKDTLTCGRKGPNTVFGVPLESLASDDSKIPIVVDRLITTIEIHGLYTEGIYRKPGVNSKVLELKARMEEGNLDSIQFDKYHVHVLASVLKSFLREMPEPLLTFDHYDDLLRAADLTEDRVITIYAILDKLPPLNFDLLERIVFHLARVALHEKANRMSANALATVFAPCLLRTDKTMRAQDSLQDISRQTMCIEVIVMEQMRRLRATLIEIDTLDTACHTVTHRLSSIRSSKVFTPEDFIGSTLSMSGSIGSEGGGTAPPSRGIPPPNSAEEEEVILLGHIEEIQKEKALLTSTLPSLTRSPSDDDLLSTDGSLDDVEPPSHTLSRHRVIHKHKKRGSEASTSSALTPPDQPPSDRDPIMV